MNINAILLLETLNGLSTFRIKYKIHLLNIFIVWQHKYLMELLILYIPSSDAR